MRHSRAGGSTAGGSPLRSDPTAVTVGLVAVAGGIAFGLLVVRAAVSITAAVASYTGFGLFVANPLQWVVLPVALVIGWVLVGALLLGGHPLGRPVAAGAFLGAAAVNLATLGTGLVLLASAIDPVTALLSLAQSLLFGLGTGLPFDLLAAAGTAVSAVAGGRLALGAHREPDAR